MSDVSGWAPDWALGREQLDRHRDALLALRGRRIVDTWLVWNLELDEWFADLPVVLAFDDGRQLEVCWQQSDDLSITWNTIDVSVAPTAWVQWPLTWRSQGHPALRGVTGRTITAVAATEYRFDPGRPWPFRRAATWLARGLWLATDGPGLHVFDALDENGLSDGAEIDDDNRVRPL